MGADVETYMTMSMFDYVNAWAGNLKAFTAGQLGQSDSAEYLALGSQQVWPMNAVALSQGGLVLRTYMQMKQGAPAGVGPNAAAFRYPIVKNAMFVHSPLAGMTGMVLCPIKGPSEVMSLLCEG